MWVMEFSHTYNNFYQINRQHVNASCFVKHVEASCKTTTWKTDKKYL